MEPIAAAVLSSWSFEPELVAGLAIVTLVYLRGFYDLRGQLPARFPTWRCAAFLAGVGALALALASPLDAFANLLLQVHMVQHWLLVMVAPPLLWLGAPAIPLLRGLPRRWLKRGLGPLLAWPKLRRGLDRLTHPLVTWLVWSLTTLAWHAPVAYEAALRSQGWHDLEHAMFLGAGLLFWVPLVAPWPARAPAERASLVLYLGAAAVFNTVFSAAFAFSYRVFYSSYQDAARPWGIDALADQNAAGAFLWAGASLPMLIGAAALLIPMLDLHRERDAMRNANRPAATRRRSRGDLRTLPVLGAALRSRALRRIAQFTLLAVAALIVVDGLFGPQQVSALNLAGVLPWTYWRGITVIGLLVLGNVFCAVCPFTLSRSISRSVSGRWLGRRLRWPAALSNKWPALGLFVVYLWAYETFALWNSPYWTAWIVIGYFASCFLIEGFFPRGTFCRHLCPIGQFNFLSAGISPLEVQRTEPAVCATCRTHDCLRGNDDAPGCPTGLFLPTKTGSLDCTFCLDCVRACPHDNAGLVAVDPGASLGSERAPGFDIAALVLVFCFGAFANAAAMVAPVSAWTRALGAELGSETSAAALAFGFALVVAPAMAALACAWIGRSLGGHDRTLREVIARLAPALVPVGFSMWLAHFSFHLATGIGTLGPAAARAASDAGLAGASPSSAIGMTLGAGAGGLEGAEIAVLGVGLVISVAVAWRLALELSGRPRHALAVAVPWMLVATALYGAGVWIVLQPMEMRGMVMG
jgi:cytochrome c oxidase assembly factor CtaG